MIAIGPQVRIFVFSQHTDMRKSFHGLSGLVAQHFDDALLSGHLFLFFNRRRDHLKVLYFDNDGLAIWYKSQESEDTHFNIFTRVEMHRTFNGIVDESRSTCF
jgi:transposase